MAVIGTLADVAAASGKQAATAFDEFAPNKLNPLKSPDHSAWKRMIEVRGVWLEHWTYVPCPCRRSDTMRADPSCESCGGTGRYYPEDKRTRLQALMQARRPNHDQRSAGIFTTGVSQFSFQAGQRVGQFDMVFPVRPIENGWEPSEIHDVTEVLTRAGQPLTNQTIYNMRAFPTQAPPVATPRPERLKYSDIIEVTDIYWRDTPSKRIVRASRADYTLKGNVIDWRPDRGPDAGAVYTVAYRAPAAYMLGEFRYRQLGNDPLPSACDGVRYDQWDPQRDPHAMANEEAVR